MHNDIDTSINKYSKWILIGFTLIYVLITVRIIGIQFFGKERLQGNDKLFVLRQLKANRGNILSDDNSVLATSLSFYEVAMDPTVVDNNVFRNHIYELCEKLEELYGKPASFYRKLLLDAKSQNKRYVKLSNKAINHKEKEQILKWPIFNLGRYSGGLILDKKNVRFLPFGELAKRTIGYVNDFSHIGLEGMYDDVLTGTHGVGLYQKIIGNHYKMVNNRENKIPINGYDIVTTININLQDIAQSSLLNILRKYKAKYGVAIVMEVNTGHIKAIVNLGRIDDGSYHEIYNYAIGSLGVYEPGSIMKTISMLALLEDHDIDLNKTIDVGNGVYKFHNIIMHDVQKYGLGTVTIQRAFEESSNIAIARLMYDTFQNKPDKYIEYIDKLHLNTTLEIPFDGIGEPYIKRPHTQDWTRVTIPWMAIGYELKVSPLQMLTVYNAIANNGVMVKPLFVTDIKDGLNIVKHYDSEIMCEKICSDRTLHKIHKLLNGVVKNGSARRYQSKYYSISGKSGTTNKLIKDQYSTVRTTSFAGYFPSEAPKYSCIVVVDEPQGAVFGSQICAPVISEIADKLATLDEKFYKSTTTL